MPEINLYHLRFRTTLVLIRSLYSNVNDKSAVDFDLFTVLYCNHFTLHKIKKDGVGSDLFHANDTDYRFWFVH